jgi:hypothetical protein
MEEKSSVTYINGDNMGAQCAPKLIEGETCHLKPKTHPCLTGAVSYSCPASNVSNSLLVDNKLQQNCNICGGVTRTLDWDGRPGWMEFQLSWGPNVFNGAIVEDTPGIEGYAVYPINDCGEREGHALVTSIAYGIKEGQYDCCESTSYVANVLYNIPSYLTSQRFRVVPVTSIGPLDIGWETDVIVDVIDSTLYGPPLVGGGSQPANPASVHTESHTHAPSELQSSVAKTKTAAPTTTTTATQNEAQREKKEEDGSPPQEGAEEEDGTLGFIIAVVVGIPVGFSGLYALSKVLSRKRAVDQEAGNAVPGEGQYAKKVSP